MYANKESTIKQNTHLDAFIFSSAMAKVKCRVALILYVLLPLLCTITSFVRYISDHVEVSIPINSFV
jgi:hypothetical protein